MKKYLVSKISYFCNEKKNGTIPSSLISTIRLPTHCTSDIASISDYLKKLYFFKNMFFYEFVVKIRHHNNTKWNL